MRNGPTRLENLHLAMLGLGPAVEIATLLVFATLIVIALCFPAVAGAATTGIEKSFEVAPGGRLEVQADGASISITTHPGNGARVKVTRGADSEEAIRRDYRVDFKQEGDLLRVEVVKLHPTRLFDFSFKSLGIDVELPKRFDATVGTSGGSVSVADLDGKVDAKTSGGSIALASIGGPVRANTSGGSIKLHSSKGDADVHTSGGSIVIGDVDGAVRAHTSGGSITIDRSNGAVTAHTSGGSIEVHEVRGAIDAETSGGSVTASLSEAPRADSSLRTAGGGVTVTLADGIGVNLDARAMRVTSDFTVAGHDSEQGRGELVGAINGGGPALVLRSTGGGIRVLRR